MYSGLTSNGSTSLRIWEKLVGKLEFISLSYHPEFANNDHFLNLYNFILSNSSNVVPCIRIMTPADPQLFKKSLELYNKIIQLPDYSYEFVKIQNDFGENIRHSHYDKAQEEFLSSQKYSEHIPNRKNHRTSVIYLEHHITYNNNITELLRPNNLVNNNQNHFSGWSCQAGIESLFIGQSGEVYKASCKIDGVFSNIQKEDFLLPDKPVKCVLGKCSCQSDIMISKNKILSSLS